MSKSKKTGSKKSPAQAANAIKKGLDAIVAHFKPTGIAAEVVAQYAKDGAEKVFTAIGAEFQNVREALTYRSAVAAHLFVAEQKSRDVAAKDYNKLLTDYLAGIVEWRMARALPDLGFLILRHHLTPEEVRGKVGVIVWNASGLKEHGTRDEFLAAVGKAKVAKQEKTRRGAQDKVTVPTAGDIVARIDRWLTANKKTLHLTLDEVSEALDQDHTASPYNFLAAVMLAAVGRGEEMEGIVAKQAQAKAGVAA